MKRRALALVLSFAMILGICVPGTYATEVPEELTLVCEQQEHTHGEDCYALAEEPSCGLEETPGHTHGEGCSIMDSVLTCTRGDEVHTHTDACYAPQRTLVCTLAEGAHVHGEGCYRADPVLNCTQETQPHVHTEGCYIPQSTKICTVEDGEHVHTDACFVTQPVLNCSLESEPHVHTDACYTTQNTPICTLDETTVHTHGEGCYEEKSGLVCTLNEGPHVHTEACYTKQSNTVCPLPESEGHTHSESCYEKTLVCTQEEHTHTADCYAPAEIEPEITSTSFGDLPEQIQEEILSIIYAKEGLSPARAAGLRAAPAMRAAGAEMVAAIWFSATPAGSVEVPQEGLPVGDILTENMPKYDKYTFVGAFFNGVRVLRIGQIQYDANQDGTPETFVYYVNNEENTDLVAQVLSEGETIELRYRENPLPIAYSVTMDGDTVNVTEGSDVTVSGIPYGSTQTGSVVVLTADRPTEVFKGDGYAFQVAIPRGYTATVSVGNTPLAPTLGVSPEYRLALGGAEDPSGNGTILKVDPNAEYELSHTYTVENAQAAQNVSIVLKKDTVQTFSANLIRQTKYFDYNNRTNSYINAQPGRRGTPWWNNNNDTAWTGNFAGGSLTWNLKTKVGTYAWLLDSLQLNGTDIRLPFIVESSETTTLPSGTVVEVKLENITNLQRAYSVVIRNCYEDVVVTGGNLNSTTWDEYIPYEFIGIAQMQFLRTVNGTSTWVEAQISQPVADEDMESGSKIRFRLLPGYGKPDLILSKSDDQKTPIVTYKDIVSTDGDGWFTVDISKDAQGGTVTIADADFPVLILAKAELIDHKVVYTGGEVTNAAPIPTDSITYSLSPGRDSDVLTPLPAPIDPSAKKVFIGWRNGDTVYRRNLNIPITDLVATWDATQGVNIITFTAEWADATTVETINYTLEVHRSDLPEDQETLRARYTSEAPKGVDVVIDVNAGSLNTWLTANPWFEVDMDKTTLYYKNLENKQTIYLYVREKTTKIHYQAVGPEGATNFGSVSSAEETVMIKSGTPFGSTATAGSGYYLAGWFLDAACTQAVPVDWVKDGAIKPTKAEADLWEETTYYAKFEPALADLTIIKTGAQAIDENQSFVFNVSGNGVNLKVVIHGNSRVTIKDLPVGQYAISEEATWSWRYTPSGPATVKLTVGGENTVTYTNTRAKGLWLNGSAYCDNHWALGGA